MLYLHVAFIGVIFGVVVYFFVFLMDLLRKKLNKPLRSLEFLAVPITVFFNLVNQDLKSQYNIAKFELFIVAVLQVAMGVLVFYLLNKFIKDISGETIAKTKNLSKSQWVLLIAKVMLGITIYVGVMFLIAWLFKI